MTAARLAAPLGSAVAAGLALGLAGCGTGPARESHAVGGTLTVGLLADVDSFNPYVANEATSLALLDLLYPRLVQETGDPARPFEPWLAQAWQLSADGLTLTFQLRDDARWTDGLPVSCADVVFTHEAQTAEELAWAGAFAKQRIADVTCPDEHTVVFRFTSAAPDPMLDANDDAIVPAVYGKVPLEEWAGTAWEERFVGCGPFQLVSVEHGEEIVLARNPRWWGAAHTSLERVVLRVYPTEEGVLPRLLDGEVDLILKVPPGRAAEVARRSDLRLVELPSLSYTYIGWNTLHPAAYARWRRERGCDTAAGCEEREEDLHRLRQSDAHPILADPAVRRALSMAIDRRDIVDGIWAGHARVGSSPIPSALWAHDPSTALPFDPSGAAELLERAGWRDSDGDGVRERDGLSFDLSVIVNAENAVRRDALERVATSLARAGVRIRAAALPRGEFVARARDKNFDAVLGGWWAGTRIEPQNLLHTRSALRRGNNLTAWGTRPSDELLDRAAASATRESALPSWRMWQAIFRAEQPLTLLYEETQLLGVAARVQGPPPRFVNPLLALHEWQVEPAAARGE